MTKILIAEDDDHTRDALREVLTMEGYEVIPASDGLQAVDFFRAESPDFVCLDVMMPGLNGYEVCKQIRRQDEKVPILFLTAKAEEIDTVLGLELGADDYMTKPFSPRELVARIKAVLRRLREKSPEEILKSGTIELDVTKHELRLKGKSAEVTAKEFELLRVLMSSRGRVLTREVLLSKVWGYENSVNIETRTVDMHIGQLRRKLGKESARIVTVKSIGYRFDGE